MEFVSCEVLKSIQKEKKNTHNSAFATGSFLQINLLKEFCTVLLTVTHALKKTHTSVNNHIFFFFKPALCRKTNIQQHDLGLIHRKRAVSAVDRE